MNVRWQLAAVSDLANIHDYLAEYDPSAANAVVERVLHSVERLERFPESGRTGQFSGTREVVVPGLPYIVVYTHDERQVDIIAVFHAAQQRP